MAPGRKMGQKQGNSETAGKGGDGNRADSNSEKNCAKKLVKKMNLSYISELNCHAVAAECSGRTRFKIMLIEKRQSTNQMISS